MKFTNYQTKINKFGMSVFPFTDLIPISMLTSGNRI